MSPRTSSFRRTPGWSAPRCREQHADIVKGAKVVESYMPLRLRSQVRGWHEETVLKGSWVLGMRWPEKVWKRIEAGELTGYSVGGHGLRVPIGEDGRWLEQAHDAGRGRGLCG